MTLHYPIVLETEANGAVSAYVPGLPVYAAAENQAKAERAIRAVLTAYLEAHPGSRPDARVRVARLSDKGKTKVDIVGVAALVGARRSATKARASRANGRLGGRPRRPTDDSTTREGDALSRTGKDIPPTDEKTRASFLGSTPTLVELRAVAECFSVVPAAVEWTFTLHAAPRADADSNRLARLDTDLHLRLTPAYTRGC